MGATEIQDWQFGQLHWEDGWGWCAENVEWMSGQTIDLCIQTELTESNTIPERARTIFNTLRDREKEFKSLAARDLLNSFNENICSADVDEDSRPEGWPFNTESFINLLGLWWVSIDTDGESELQYITGMPLLRVIISPDLSFMEAFFDCYYQ